MSSNKNHFCPPSCPLASNGFDYIPASGPDYADIAICGPTPNRQSEPKLNSLLRRSGLDRDNLRIFNIINCQPNYENTLVKQSFVKQAVWECQAHVQPLLREPHKVFVPMGHVAAQSLLNFQGNRDKPFKLQDWHGCPSQVNGRWIVPSYDAAFLMAGNQKLTGVVAFDLAVAKRVASGEWKPQPAILRVDPSLEWFTKWVDALLAAAETSEIWCSIDTETVEKMTGKAEDELDGGQAQIVRINFSCNPDEGLTVPFIGGYIDQSRRICKSKKLIKVLHNRRYDWPLLREVDCSLEYPHHDSMHLWKYTQSDLPMGLGFIAPFYSNYLYQDSDTGILSGAWKHLSGSKPGDYAAIDSFQTLRIALGMRRDLIKSNIWDTYLRHVYDLDRIVLHPAEDVGLYVNREKLLKFKAELEIKEADLEAKIRSQVDENNQPLIGKWKKPPKDKPASEILEREIELEVFYCTDCNERDVTQKHICDSVKEAKRNAKAAEKLALKANKPRKPRGKKLKSIPTDSNNASELSAGPVSTENS